MLANPKLTMAATKTKTAVQVPCIEIAFRAIETLNMADPATKVKTSFDQSAEQTAKRREQDGWGPSYKGRKLH